MSTNTFWASFLIAAGKRGGEFYTPKSIVSLIVEMLEPFDGAYDPCCGSGGFFVRVNALCWSTAAR